MPPGHKVLSVALNCQAMLQVLSLNGLIPGDLEETTGHVHTKGDR